MRPITNLRSKIEFRLPKAAARVGFVSMFNTQMGIPAYEFAFKLATRLIWPWAKNEDPSIHTRTLKEWVTTHVKDPSKAYSVKSVLRKNLLTKTLEFKTPIFRVRAAGNDYLSPGVWAYQYKFPGMSEDAILALKNSVKSIDDTAFAGGAVLTSAQVITATGFTGRTADILKSCLTSVEATKDGEFLVLYATWKITQAEAEYLNNVPFNQLKLANFYPTLIDWASSVYGKDTNLPTTVCPISNISTEVESIKASGKVVPRVGLNGVVVDINRNYFKIPEVNSALEYEQLLLEFGTQEDGSYTWHQPSDGTGEHVVGDQRVARKKLPINMPIYTDWVNDKFAYSNSAGNLAVYDLSNTAPLDNFHLNALLNTPIDVSGQSKDGAWHILCTAVDMAYLFNRALLAEKPTEQEITAPKAREYLASKVNNRVYQHFREMAEDAMQMHLFQNEGSTDDMFVSKSGSVEIRVFQAAKLPAFGWMFRILANALGTLQANREVAFTRYSVMNVLQQLTVLELVVEYSPKQEQVEAADLAARADYLNQGVDPNYAIEEVPQVKAGLKYMPHQAKVQNIMRKGPKNAVYPIDAGGGKTIVILTGIALEMKRGLCKKPVILCPSHLVAQYVKEVVFVTEGRMNIIPVTNASLKMHGEEKLKKFIEAAPINTIVVTDMNFLKGRKNAVAYGNKSLDVYRNAEFMRQFEFDLIAIDEVHYLKNLRSARRDAAARFMQDIPMKRIASGTIVSDTIKDVVSQFALLDPLVFGSDEAFKNEFAGSVRGEKVTSWAPGAEAEVRRRMAQHAVVASARRKEWAALLPPKKERFIGVELTKNQRLLYESILEETMELINEAMAKDAEVRDLMGDEDDSKAEELEAKLRPYLARLERFMSAPEADQAAQVFLKDPNDLISPKVLKIYEICKEHLESNIPGKVLIFTQYTASAESVYVNAPPELKKHMIWYTADQKAEAKVEFENNPNKKIMVGVSSSMDTGLNLQFASRLIRMETVWTPGVLEQGNSRINRPELKKAEDRNMVFFDWIVINKSIDITKVSRLVSKIISKAKFDEYDNPAYEVVPDMPQVAMTLESIAANNDFNEELLPYLEAYDTFQQVEQADFDEYRRQQGNNIVPLDVPQGGILENSKLMSRVPYIPEMELYGVDKLGLVRYDHFVRQDLSELEEDTDTGNDSDDEKDGDENEAMDAKSVKRAAIKAQLAKERPMVMNRPVHTDMGDGTITFVGPRRVKVRLADGSVVRFPKLQVYIITRSTTNGIDMRNELLKEVGKIPLDTPIVVPVEDGAQDKKRKKKRDEPSTEAPSDLVGPTAEFDFTVMNDFLALMYRGDGSDAATVDTLQSLGFRITPHYLYVKIPGPILYLKFMKELAAKGFSLTKDNSDELVRIYHALKVNKKAMSTFGFATKMDITNFFRAQIKPSADASLLKIYPLVQDGFLYLLFPTKGQPANQKARRVQVAGLSWKESTDTELLKLYGNKGEAKEGIKQIMQSGITIPEDNLSQLKTQFTSIRLVVR